MSPASLTSNSHLDPPYGAHPTIVTDIQISIPPRFNPSATVTPCSLYLQYRLPPLLFVDAYELAMRTRDYNVTSLRGSGSKELEKPVHALPVSSEPDGVELVIQKTLPADTHPTREIQVQLPIHVRYGKADPAGSTIVDFSSPQIVLVCPRDSHGTCLHSPTLK